MTHDIEHEIAMAEHALLSVTGQILCMANEAPMRRRMDTDSLKEARQRIDDAIVLIERHKEQRAA